MTQSAFIESRPLPEFVSCRAEVSWSSTGRSVSMALAAIKLYERAVEFAAIAECVFSGVSLPVKEEVAA